MYPVLTNGAAALIQNFGTEEQKNKYMFKMYEGKWGGTKCLTDPARQRRRRPEDDRKRLPRQYHITVTGASSPARSRPDGQHHSPRPGAHRRRPPGTAGISFSSCPVPGDDDGSLGEFNDVKTVNIEHKMVIKASATCTLNFGEDGSASASSSQDARMRVMFQMMNEAPMEVGMQSLSRHGGLRAGLAYTRERIQMTPVWR
jgi:alkylation response protein AidB-like acyl-CoA dehydrogenase